jgi:cysteine synthase A
LDILDAIGNTSLVRLRKVAPPGGADVFAKLEWENPTGSMKDRMALAVITRAEEDGRLRPGDTVARQLSREPRTFWIDQLNNQDSIAGYDPLGEEIWSQTQGEIDAFVHSAGAAASSRGVAAVLKRHKPGIKIVVVEPAESSVLRGGQAGAHRIEGIGIGRTPPLWEPALVDDILPVSTGDAEDMARRLAREEALFAGTSSGANVVAAVRVAEGLGPGSRVVTLMVDSGLKYLSTGVYKNG